MAAKYPTQEHKHGMYVQLLRDKSEEYLRKSFHKTFSRNPTKLYIELKKLDPDLQKLLRKGILNQKQYDTLFPLSKQTDSSKFDTTLLFLLLRHFCGYKAPITGWNNEPDKNDRSEIANLIRLKIGRNRIQHLSPSITNAEYKAVYLYLRQPLIDLGCPLNDICHARSFKYDNQPAIRSFLGREDELDQIRQLIHNNQPIHGTVITGIPGVGKTELAKKYCQEYEQEFEHIIWVNCDSLENSFQDIAESLNLNCRQNDRFTSLKVIAKLVSEYFKNEKVLFVFDNCVNGSEDLVDVLFPQHRNIITTQARSWGQDYQSIELKVWPKDIAFDFLAKNLKHGKNLFGKLIDEFDCHPLALQHAVAFINEMGLSLKEYLEILSQHKLDILSERVALQHGVTKSVFSSFLIIIDRIKKKYPQIFEFLQIFSVLEINFIKEEFLDKYFTTRFDFIKSIKVLQNFSLVRQCLKVSEHGRQKSTFYTMHSLYQCSIQTYQTLNGEKIFHEIFKMIVKYIKAAVTNSVWFHQFQYLWNHNKKSDFRKHLLHEIANNFFYIFIGLCNVANRKFSDEIIEELYEEWKDKKNDITLYYIKHGMARMKGDYNAWVNKMRNILLEIEQNVLTPSPEKQQLIGWINYTMNDKDDDFQLFDEGYYLQYLKVGLIRNEPHYKAICLKELKKYAEALEIFCKNEATNLWVNTSLEIACCYILQGKREEGLRVAGKVVDDICPVRVPLQIGRALFDVGFYEESNKYLYEFMMKLSARTTGGLFYEILDGWSKVVIQNYCIEPVFEFASRLVFDCYDNVMFRARILACCCLIRHFEYTRAFGKAEQLLQDQQKKQCSRMWFREGLLIAKHLMRRHEYYQALLIYQMIQRFQHELRFIPKQTLDGVAIDIQQSIDVCLHSFMKIFKI